MSNYTKSLNKTFEFEGDFVQVSFSRMKRKHIRLLAGYDLGNLTTEQSVALIDNAAPIFECVNSVTGLTDAEGTPLGVDVITEEAYFMPLAMDILAAIIEASFVTKTDEGNSEGPSKEPSTA